MIAVDTMVLLMLGAQPAPRFVAEVRSPAPDREVTVSICGRAITFTYPAPRPPVALRERPPPRELTTHGERIGVLSIDRNGDGVLLVRPPEEWRGLARQVSLGYSSERTGGGDAAS